MDKVLRWNVRGVNNINKQKAVKDIIHRYAVGMVGLLKTKVKAPNLGALYHRVFIGWCFSSNVIYHANGRIITAWKLGNFSVTIIKVLLNTCIVLFNLVMMAFIVHMYMLLMKDVKERDYGGI